MAGNDSKPPSVPLSFSNHFWGVEEKGVGVLLQRMRDAKQTCEEIKSFYKERIAIEEEYSRRLTALSRKALGQAEVGTLKSALEGVRLETEQSAKAHANTGVQLRTELEGSLVAFASGLRERRKSAQASVDKLWKVKQAQQLAATKARDKYEADCNKVSGCLAQQSMASGRELQRNTARLEKAQSTVTASRRDYQLAVRNLAETTQKWDREWKIACDRFQDLEEERIDFLKSNIWAYTNILSTVCVSDDEFCENIRVALESCDVEKDIITFVKERGTGQEIPHAPEYINFMDGLSGPSEGSDAYSLAQFSRQQNPQFKTSPIPEVMEEITPPVTREEDTVAESLVERPSQIDNLLASLAYGPNPQRTSVLGSMRSSTKAPESPSSLKSSRSRAGTDASIMAHPMESVIVLQHPDEQLSSAQSSPVHRGRSPSGESSSSHATTVSSGDEHELTTPVKVAPPQPASPAASLTPTRSNGSASPPKKRNGWNIPFRRRDNSSTLEMETAWTEDHVDADDAPRRLSPSKGITPPYVAKYAVSTPDLQEPQVSPSPGRRQSPMRRSPGGATVLSRGSQREPSPEPDAVDPIDPRANVVLSVGENQFAVSRRGRQDDVQDEEVLDNGDPLRAALASLRGEPVVETQRRQPAQDKYAALSGNATRASQRNGRRVISYSAPTSPANNAGRVEDGAVAPPPTHVQQVPMRQPDFSTARPARVLTNASSSSPATAKLAAPPAAYTSADMMHTSGEFASRTRQMFGGLAPPRRRATETEELGPGQYHQRSPSRAVEGGSPGGYSQPPRSRSRQDLGGGYQEPRRSNSRQDLGDSPGGYQQPPRATSRQDGGSPGYQPPRSTSRQDGGSPRSYYAGQGRSPSGSPGYQQPPRNVSRQDDGRPVSSYGRSPSQMEYGSNRVSPAGRNIEEYSVAPSATTMRRPRSAYFYGEEQVERGEIQQRPRSGYDTADRPARAQSPRAQSRGDTIPGDERRDYDRLKSKSAMDMRRPVELPTESRDGQPVLSYARAMYDYRAMIPEEVSFRKGDVLLVLQMQDDGWWETEVFGPRSRPQVGLAPSNFLHTL
ncbi:uncharacterized protein V1518DRAFT_423531 [Limtongia smithiae]|uniref:uncharacterized protein n=1 Tax=Limtongia smithiae TaxID=1125753 RepID=UPI0034CDDE91